MRTVLIGLAADRLPLARAFLAGSEHVIDFNNNLYDPSYLASREFNAAPV
jgi:hypothetical protein